MAEGKVGFQAFQTCLQDLSNALNGIEQSLKTLTKESFKFSPSSSHSAEQGIPSSMVALNDQAQDSAMAYAERLQEMLEAVKSTDSPSISSAELQRALRTATYKAKLSRGMAQTLHDRDDSVALISSLQDIIQFIENEKLDQDASDGGAKESDEKGSNTYLKKLVSYIKSQIKEALNCNDLTVNVEEFKTNTDELQLNVNRANAALERNIEELDRIVSNLESLGKNTNQEEVMKKLSNVREPARKLEEACSLMYIRLSQSKANDINTTS